MSLPSETYTQRITDLSTEKKQAENKRSILAWTRFAIAIIIGLCIYFLYGYPWFYLTGSLVALVAIFLRLLVLSANNNNKISNLENLLLINRKELEFLAGNYYNQPDGKTAPLNEHPYAEDLDIFGRASLYQYINRTTSEQGSRRLSDWLLHPATAAIIKDRQHAALELSPLYSWRQQYMAHGMANKVMAITESRVLGWSKEPASFTAPSLQGLRYILPAIIFGFLCAYLLNYIPAPIFSGIAFLFFLIAGAFSLKITPIHNQLNKVSREMQTLLLSVESIERLQPKSANLTSIYNRLKTPDGKASAIIKRLTVILNRMEVRMNPFVHVFLNTFLFWDLQQALELTKWKKLYSALLPEWFASLAEIEAISTLATIHFNHPHWTMPKLSEDPSVFIAKDLGHPLIPEKKMVPSSFGTSGKAKLALVTGSNMAGKSTFLRSIGVNIVLAMMGAPVCATSLTLSPMRVMSSMRIMDNLEESTSTFYAELKKLKQIIEAANNHEMIFILLDEILRGTNSLDRNTGSKALIKQLINEKAAGILATHDLQLAEMVSIYPENLTNYHFDVQIKDEELFFDYKLKDGVCKSMNASILMRKIGIRM